MENEVNNRLLMNRFIFSEDKIIIVNTAGDLLGVKYFIPRSDNSEHALGRRFKTKK